MSMALTRAKKLRLAQRDLRIITIGMGSTRRLSAVEFSHGVLARYLKLQAQVSAPELALGRLHPRITIRNTHRHTHTHLALRKSLTVLGWRGQSLNSLAASPLTLRLCVEQQRLTHAQRPRAAVSIITVPIEKLATRMIAKSGRVESIQEDTPGNLRQAKAVVIDGAAPARLSASAVEPVEKVVRRSKAVEAVRDTSSRSVEVAGAESRSQAKAVNPWQQSPGVAIEVNRLTDQVIQAIDRRIVAQRERMGQHNWRS
jgi:hypothetical protein